MLSARPTMSSFQAGVLLPFAVVISSVFLSEKVVASVLDKYSSTRTSNTDKAESAGCMTAEGRHIQVGQMWTQNCTLTCVCIASNSTRCTKNAQRCAQLVRCSNGQSAAEDECGCVTSCITSSPTTQTSPTTTSKKSAIITVRTSSRITSTNTHQKTSSTTKPATTSPSLKTDQTIKVTPGSTMGLVCPDGLRDASNYRYEYKVRWTDTRTGNIVANTPMLLLRDMQEGSVHLYRCEAINTRKKEVHFSTVMRVAVQPGIVITDQTSMLTATSSTGKEVSLTAEAASSESNVFSSTTVLVILSLAAIIILLLIIGLLFVMRKNRSSYAVRSKPAQHRPKSRSAARRRRSWWTSSSGSTPTRGLGSSTSTTHTDVVIVGGGTPKGGASFPSERSLNGNMPGTRAHESPLHNHQYLTLLDSAAEAATPNSHQPSNPRDDAYSYVRNFPLTHPTIGADCLDNTTHATFGPRQVSLSKYIYASSPIMPSVEQAGKADMQSSPRVANPCLVNDGKASTDPDMKAKSLKLTGQLSIESDGYMKPVI